MNQSRAGVHKPCRPADHRVSARSWRRAAAVTWVLIGCSSAVAVWADIPEHFVALQTATPTQIGRVYASAASQLRRDAFEWTALMVSAAGTPYVETIRYILGRGGGVDARDLNGWTALMFAAGFNSEPAIVEALVAAGADVAARTNEAWTIAYGASRITDTIVEFEPPPASAGADGLSGLLASTFGGSTLNAATLGGDSAADQPTTPAQAVKGWTPLFFAGRFNANPAVTAALLSAGAAANAVDEYGNTALYYARRYNPNQQVAATLATAAP